MPTVLPRKSIRGCSNFQRARSSEAQTAAPRCYKNALTAAMARLASVLFQLLSASAALRAAFCTSRQASIAGRLVPCTCIAMPLCCSVSASAHISPETVDNIRSSGEYYRISSRIMQKNHTFVYSSTHFCDDVLRYLVASAGDL